MSHTLSWYRSVREDAMWLFLCGSIKQYMATLVDRRELREEVSALQAREAELIGALEKATKDWTTKPLDGEHGWISYCRFCGTPAWDYDAHEDDCPVGVLEKVKGP